MIGRGSDDEDWRDLNDAPPALTKLGRWARDARDAYVIAQSLAKTVFVPKEMQQRPDLVTAAILTGAELGLEPMASLRSIDIIQGVPAMRANTMRGLVQAAGHEVWVDQDSNETRAIVYGRRKGSDNIQRSHWSMDRAHNLGLANRDNYKKQPGAMLVARGTAEVCRLIASDVLLGMPYAVEELDEGESQPQTAAPKKPSQRKRTTWRKPIDPPPVPDLEAPQPPQEPHEQEEAADDTPTDAPVPEEPGFEEAQK